MVIVDISKNKKAIMKVSLNTSPSSPLREKEFDIPPQTWPKPVPLTWISIKKDRNTATIICTTSNISFIPNYNSNYLVIQ